MAIARIIRTVGWIVAAIIVAAILLFVFSANPHNTLVSDIHDAATWLAGPFKNIFSLSSAKATMAVNYGIAAIVYVAIAHLLAALIMRAPRRSFGRRARPVT